MKNIHINVFKILKNNHLKKNCIKKYTMKNYNIINNKDDLSKTVT
jgi:hypothetical protein